MRKVLTLIGSGEIQPIRKEIAPWWGTPLVAGNVDIKSMFLWIVGAGNC